MKNAGEEWDDIQSISAGGQITLSAVPVPALLLSGLRPATLQDQLENDWKGQDSWQPFSIKFSRPYSSGRFCRVQHTKVIFCKAFLRAARPAPLPGAGWQGLWPPRSPGPWEPWQRLPPILHEAAHTLFLNTGFFAEARAAPCGPSGSSPASEPAAAFAAANRWVPGPPRSLRQPSRAGGSPQSARTPHNPRPESGSGRPKARRRRRQPQPAGGACGRHRPPHAHCSADWAGG